MPTVLAEGTSIIPAETFTNLTTAVSNGAQEIVSNGVTMISTVAPYALAIIGVGIVVGIAFKWIKRARG
ncbi:MAG: hypothetical protein K6G28_04590 [Acholeplasmatales bacterium]|nr:hypothetical protein [Acholeplasmatales bacterium]